MAAGAASPGGRASTRSAAPAGGRGGRGTQAADPLQPEPSGDAVTAAVRTAAGLAVAGARVAGAVGRELVRRLPRP
jgi:hypothetical protein